MPISLPAKIINRLESAKPHPVIFIGWVLLIATLRYYLEIVLVYRFDIAMYVYHTLYYITIFLFIPTLLLYLITREDIDRIINIVVFLIFPFKVLSVIVDRLILGNMQAYNYLQGKPIFLLKYVFLFQGDTSLSYALFTEWIVISLLIGLYAAYKRRPLWLFPIFAYVTYLIIVFSGGFVSSIIFPVGGSPIIEIFRQFLHQKSLMHVLIEVNTLLKNPHRFYGSLFAAISFILFLTYAAVYLKERRGRFFRLLWWIIPVALIGPFITFPFYVYDAIITGVALLAISLFAGFMLYHGLLEGNEKIWSCLIFMAYSLLFTIYTARTYLFYILGSLIAITMLLNLIFVLGGRLRSDTPPL